ncbi:MAG: helix-turn-helix transcriptional regulator [Chitinophagaceae bacterium]|nr:helix-turn-helix transcriptional regulator [Chitinophagaceae bacterium]MCW5926244.1 helix-turn-helix transcriptional regulator [Chitinophagaceae bacterium]
MQEDILIQISNKIKETRKFQKKTVQELATEAQVSKGLISQIENNRTVPSLPVLMNIVLALKVDLKDFFEGISHNKESTQKVIIKTPADYHPFEKETAKGFKYKRILTRNMDAGPVDTVLLELKKGARRTNMITTDAYEYKYILKGQVEYQIENDQYVLNEGDSLFFDGRLPHKPANVGDEDALMLIIYYFITTGR